MERQFIRSERAHFMCPNMYFGILAKIKGKVEIQKIERTLDLMAVAHPFLRSVIKYDDDHVNLYYDVGEKATIQLYERSSFSSMWEDYKRIGLKEWNVLKNGLLKVFIYPDEKDMRLLFVAHHLLGDGRCLLELVEEFGRIYVEDIKPTYSPERLIRTLDDLPPNSDLKGVSSYLVKSMNNKWRKEHIVVTYEEYEKFSDEFAAKNPVAHEIKEVDPRELKAMKSCCKENKITINDLLMAKTYISLETNKIIIAADVRDRISCYNKGAYGNYATAMGIVSKSKTKDVIKRAKEVHKQVKLHMEDNRKLMLILSCYLNMDQTLIDSAAISTLGEFKSKAAKLVGASMFGYQKRDGISITNLGQIKSRGIIEAAFIPPASPATTQTIGVLTVNDKMRISVSYYENAVSKEKVEKFLEELEK